VLVEFRYFCKMFRTAAVLLEVAECSVRTTWHVYESRVDTWRTPISFFGFRKGVQESCEISELCQSRLSACRKGL
jgi:hypothetical protein